MNDLNEAIKTGREIGNEMHDITPAGRKYDIKCGDHMYHFYTFDASTEFTIDDDPTIYDICEFNERSAS